MIKFSNVYRIQAFHENVKNMKILGSVKIVVTRVWVLKHSEMFILHLTEQSLSVSKKE